MQKTLLDDANSGFINNDSERLKLLLFEIV